MASHFTSENKYFSKGDVVKKAKFSGLTDEQVLQSRQKHGINVLTPPKRKPWWQLFLEKFEDPVIRILLIAAVLSIAIGAIEGKYTEGIGIVIAIILATGIAFLNEYKANAEFDILNKVNDDIPVEVIRNGKFTAIPRKDLVVGDVFLQEFGEEIPADAEILESVGFLVNEARLTGETVPVPKHPDGQASSLKETTYDPHMAMRGTIVVDGHATLRVTQVGDQSEIGRTARLAGEETGNVTPLNQQLEKLSQLIGVLAFIIAAVIFTSLVIRGIWHQEFVLTYGQWMFMGWTGLSAMIALGMVWVPVAYDALVLIKWKEERPQWIENNSLKAWLLFLSIGVLLWGCGVAFFIQSGALPAQLSEWIPRSVLMSSLVYFMIAVTIIVVAVPEGLALSVTLCLAYSMRKMIASNNLVRQMHACETIGSATVICSDKTGTLTTNEMRVEEEHFPYRSSGKIDEEELISLSIAINSTAHLQFTEDAPPSTLGNPTEGALLLWLYKFDVDYLAIRDKYSVVRQWTFTTDRKYMATYAKIPSLGDVLLLKGAPEILLDRCYAIHQEDDLVVLESQRESILAQLSKRQERGMRSIAFAYKKLEEGVEEEDLDILAKDLVWLGFVAIADPVREDVPEAIHNCMKAGVQVKIVTGDNARTAKEIARQVHLWEDKDDQTPFALVNGPEFNSWSDEEVAERVDQIKVLARAKPVNKLRLVNALQAKKHVVAVTGDGPNDAPALNHADVGLAMGKTGSSIAKEASDIILLDDSFTSITRAILWGRSLYQNIQRFLIFQLTINVAALGIALLGPFIGVKLPLTVMQMLWINLIMDTLAALALATEPPNKNLLNKPPRKPEAFIIDGRMAGMIFGGGLLFVFVMVAMILGYLGEQTDTQEWRERATVFFSMFIFLQFWNMFNAKAFGTGHSAFKGLFANKAFLLIAAVILLGQILIVQLGGTVFRTTPLSFQQWLVVIAATSGVLWIGEIVRFFFKPLAAQQV